MQGYNIFWTLMKYRHNQNFKKLKAELDFAPSSRSVTITSKYKAALFVGYMNWVEMQDFYSTAG